MRHIRLRLHLRLHPGRGYATCVELWLRWGRLAAFRRSGRTRPSLTAWQRMRRPREHSVLVGRAQYRHQLAVPLEEHLLLMAPPRTYKTALLASVVLHYPVPMDCGLNTCTGPSPARTPEVRANTSALVVVEITGPG